MAAQICRSSGKRVAVVKKNYRAFALGSTGDVLNRHDFISTNDAAALEHALQYVDNHDVEVWQLHRQVGLLRRTDKVA